MSRVNFDFEDGKLNIGLDSDGDGQKSLDMTLSLTEAMQEVISRGEKVEGAKIVAVDFQLTKLVISIDSDRDGEKLLDMTIDLGESFDEARKKLVK